MSLAPGSLTKASPQLRDDGAAPALPVSPSLPAYNHFSSPSRVGFDALVMGIWGESPTRLETSGSFDSSNSSPPASPRGL